VDLGTGPRVLNVAISPFPRRRPGRGRASTCSTTPRDRAAGRRWPTASAGTARSRRVAHEVNAARGRGRFRQAPPR
jgi:hypothetical protein